MLKLALQGVPVTTIGFLKEAPCVCVHGFNVYHKKWLTLISNHHLDCSNMYIGYCSNLVDTLVICFVSFSKKKKGVVV